MRCLGGDNNLVSTGVAVAVVLMVLLGGIIWG